MLFHMQVKIFPMATKQKMDDQVGDKETSFKFSKLCFLE